MVWPTRDQEVVQVDPTRAQVVMVRQVVVS